MLTQKIKTNKLQAMHRNPEMYTPLQSNFNFNFNFI